MMPTHPRFEITRTGAQEYARATGRDASDLRAVADASRELATLMLDARLQTHREDDDDSERWRYRKGGLDVSVRCSIERDGTRRVVRVISVRSARQRHHAAGRAKRCASCDHVRDEHDPVTHRCSAPQCRCASYARARRGGLT